ncbi:MAG TPA: HD domain-containing protein, partial [Gemmatimonadales bacterium]|nr:HD domain-containing protein [Gemmatimonadales bacterium]
MTDAHTSPSLRPTIPAWARMSEARVEHVVRVAQLVDGWAHAMLVPEPERHRWLRAVWLHDALRDAPEPELQEWASATPGPVELKHGPAAAARAKADGEVDRGVLDAVRYHSVGLAEWDMVGRVLYCADYLEPGRDFDVERRAALATRFPEDCAAVLREVVQARLHHAIAS